MAAAPGIGVAAVFPEVLCLGAGRVPQGGRAPSQPRVRGVEAPWGLPGPWGAFGLFISHLSPLRRDPGEPRGT